MNLKGACSCRRACLVRVIYEFIYGSMHASVHVHGAKCMELSIYMRTGAILEDGSLQRTVVYPNRLYSAYFKQHMKYRLV